VKWTADHGGRFVLAGSLTLSDQQRDYFTQLLSGPFAHLLETYRRLYPPGSYSPSGDYNRRLGLRVRELCLRSGIADRIPRPIIPGDRRHANKRLVEWLANQAYALELEGAASSRVWTYRKAAWAIEELEQDVRRVRSELGLHGLESIPGVGAELGSEIDRFLASLAPSPSPQAPLL
jgi:hypothetical protein